MKELLIEQNRLTSSEATQLRECKDCEELYRTCMGHDFYAITPCSSLGIMTHFGCLKCSSVLSL